MNLYDECLQGVEELLSEYPHRKAEISFPPSWKESDRNEILFPSDTAYELGYGSLPAVSSIALTDDKEKVPCDEVIIIGDDLNDIRGNSPFARIALIRVSPDSLGDGNKLYNTIRKIEYTRYHVSPQGYMMRVSTFSHRESVRVGKDALKDGVSFAKVGELFIDGYKKSHPGVEAVKLIFVTQKDFPYKKLEGIMQKSEDITKALDHLMKDLKMDCNVCSLKAVCEEVEQLMDKNE